MTSAKSTTLRKILLILVFLDSVAIVESFARDSIVVVCFREGDC